MSLLSALVSNKMCKESAQKATVEAGRDALAAKTINAAAESGNAPAQAFVADAKARLAQASVRKDRAERLRQKSARATMAGEHRLAVLGSDMAAAEELMGAELEASVIDAVRTSYGANPFYTSEKEARLMHQSDVLQRSSTGSVEKALQGLLDKTLAEATNYGRDDLESDEFGAEEDEEMAAERIGVAAEIYGGDLPNLLGADAIGAITDAFKASREKLEKRLAQRKAALAKLKEKIDSGKKVPKASTRVSTLKKSIAKIQSKLKKLGAAESKVKTAAVESVSVEDSEAAALAELQALESEDEEVESFELEEGSEGSDADLEAEVMGGTMVGWAPRPARGRSWAGRPGLGRRGGRGRGWVGPVVREVVTPVVVEVEAYDEDEDDEDLMIEVMGSDHSDVIGAGDSFVAYFDKRAADTSEMFGAGSQPMASVVEVYGQDAEGDVFGGIIDSIAEFFSSMFSDAKAVVKKIPAPGYNAPRRPSAQEAKKMKAIEQVKAVFKRGPKSDAASVNKAKAAAMIESQDEMGADDEDLISAVMGEDDESYGEDEVSDDDDLSGDDDSLAANEDDSDIPEDDSDLISDMAELGV